MNGSGLYIEKKKKNSKSGFASSVFKTLQKDMSNYRLKDGKKEMLYVELHSMLGAGMDIMDSLDVILDQQKDKKDKELFQKIRNELIRGLAFHECLRNSRLFTPFEYYSVQIGEESGKMTEVLGQLSVFYTKKIKLRQQIIKSLSYPLVIIITSLIAVLFMMTFIVPMFSEVFDRFNAELPLITKTFIAISHVIRNYLWAILLGSLFLFSLSKYYWKNVSFIKFRQRTIVNTPYIGLLVREIYLARFCASMSLLLGARVPLVQAISLVKKMVGFYPISDALEKVEQDLIMGGSLADCMSNFDTFDSKMLSLIKVGEEVNRLDFFFEKLNSWYSDNVDSKANTLNTFLEPLIVGFLGILIAVMLLAMYLPMFKLSTSIN